MKRKFLSLLIAFALILSLFPNIEAKAYSCVVPEINCTFSYDEVQLSYNFNEAGYELKFSKDCETWFGGTSFKRDLNNNKSFYAAIFSGNEIASDIKTIDYPEVFNESNSSTCLKTVFVGDKFQSFNVPDAKFTSSDSNIASVDENGIVTAKKAGDVDISYSVQEDYFDENGHYVNKINGMTMFLTVSNSINTTLSTLYIGDSFDLTKTFPGGIDYSIKSIDNNIVDIENNKIVAKAAGTANIKLDISYPELISTTSNNACTITIKEFAKATVATMTTIDDVLVGNSFKLDLSDIEGTITSIQNNTPDIISIDSNNNVESLKVGAAEILVKSETATKNIETTISFNVCDVQVHEPHGMSGLAKKSINVYMLSGDEIQLDLSQHMNGNDNSYSDTNDNIIKSTYDENTKKLTIKAKSKGMSTCSVTNGSYVVYDNGDFSAWYDVYEFNVYVLDPVLTADMTTLGIDYNQDLPEDFLPYYSIDNKTWTTSGSSISGKFNKDGILYISFPENEFENRRISTVEYKAYTPYASSVRYTTYTNIYSGTNKDININFSKELGNKNSCDNDTNNDIATCTCNISAGTLNIHTNKTGKKVFAVTTGNEETDDWGNSNSSFHRTEYNIYVIEPVIETQNNKIYIKYNENLPEDFKPKFSTDGINWTSSRTLERNTNNDGKIYIDYSNNSFAGNIEEKTFNISMISGMSKDPHTEELTVGTIFEFSGISGYSSFDVSDKDVISFDSSKMTVTAKKPGTSTLTFTYNSKGYNASGAISYFTRLIEYTFIVKESKNTTKTTEYDVDTKLTVITDNSKSKWHNDSVGWWYEKDGSYLKSTWAQIDGSWYYFDSTGYMESNCYRDGCWLSPSGAWDPNYSSGKWMSNAKGWWYQDGNWYPTSQWLKIDGDWYYFKSSGYMAADEWIDGYYLNKSGVWTY